ncbi:hypothetical protein POM88_018777 [Heracleum sosnowskyi]|uniref:Uncharacterized protein n=1 Tax=Heracleum sosnowskyi TaxID=360622 RepID=A0AAD8IT32_9APIA|nr:hypothetical protein POM88_018777 [Heracleum sosnowskyi]
MAIWRKNNLSSTSEEKKTKTRTLQLPKEQEGKRKAILDLNMPYVETEENNDVETVLSTKRSGFITRSDDKTSASMINVHKHTTFVPPKLMVMGCVACHIYVMVQDNYRICPRCGKCEYLIDVAARVNANKKRAI